MKDGLLPIAGEKCGLTNSAGSNTAVSLFACHFPNSSAAWRMTAQSAARSSVEAGD
jgi:hypothetical protein